MTTSRIIYSNTDGSVAVIIPAESVELALKDVPAGVPYWVVDVTEIPSDRLFRSAWEISADMPAPAGYSQ